MNTSKNKYSNCKIYAPNMKLMCVNSEKKGRWYVEKTNAKVLSYKEDGTLAEIQLTFEPKGSGYDENDEFGLSVQASRCVVSGVDDIDILTKHHIVPISYRRHFPIEYKSRNHHDVVYITEALHDVYERIGNKFREELAKQYGAMNYNEAIAHYVKMTDTPEIKRMKKIKGCVTVLLNPGDTIPAARYSEMLESVVNYIREIYSVETDVDASLWYDRILRDIETEMELITAKYKIDPHKDLVDKIGDIDKFVKIWRQHFVDTMRPQFLPIGWSVEYKTKVNI
mgnify:FL=1